jgi:hypothetical protein
MKSSSFIVSMKKMPRNDIDVFLLPLIKELKELWHEVVNAYDAFMKEVLILHDAMVWTISDFPGLGNHSGWNTYGGKACPTCNNDFEI